MSRTWVTRPLITLAVAMGFVIGTPGMAVAKQVVTPGYSYISDQDCAWTQAWLNDTGGNPQLYSVGTQDFWGGGGACTNNTWSQGGVAVQQNLLGWFNGSWQQCNTNAPWVSTGGVHDVWTGFSWSRPPCGPAYYRSKSQAWSHWNNQWHSHTPIAGNDWVIAQ